MLRDVCAECPEVTRCLGVGFCLTRRGEELLADVLPDFGDVVHYDTDYTEAAKFTNMYLDAPGEEGEAGADILGRIEDGDPQVL